MKKIVLYALLALSLTTVSCSDDFLEVDHYSIVSPEGVYSNKENIFKGLVGIYNSLYAINDYYMKPHIALANLPALDLQANGWDAEMSTHSWGVESKSSFFENAWKYSYIQISRANLYLKDLENIDESIFSKEEKEIYEAEVRAIRAAAYYFLTINFSRVPMLLTGENYASSPDKARPESDAEAWALIKEDFEYAASKLDWEPAEGMVGRFTKGGALAYAAKVNMYLGDYTTAKTQYEQIINSGNYQLNPCFAMTSWVDNENSEEAIWEIAFPQYPSMGYGIYSYTSYFNYDWRMFTQQFKPYEYGGWSDSYTSYEFVRSFEPGDKRKFYSITGWEPNGSDIDPNSGKPYGDTNPFTGEAVGSSEQWQKHYLTQCEHMPNNHSMKWWKTKDMFASFSVNLYRYTGVLLDYAECCFRTGNENQGWKTLDEIRNRAWGNLEVGYDPATVSDSYLAFPTQLLNTEIVEVPDAKTVYTAYKQEKGYTSDAWLVAVTQERRKEFHFEFSLWYDLCRCNLVEEWLNCEYPKNGGATYKNTKTGKYYIPTGVDRNQPWDDATPEERADMIPVIPRNWDWNPIHLVYPIPTSELTANPLMEQNPGYQ